MLRGTCFKETSSFKRKKPASIRESSMSSANSPCVYKNLCFIFCPYFVVDSYKYFCCERRVQIINNLSRIRLSIFNQYLQVLGRRNFLTKLYRKHYELKGNLDSYENLI